MSKIEKKNVMYFHGKHKYSFHGRNLKTGNRCFHNPNTIQSWMRNWPKGRFEKLSYVTKDILCGLEYYFFRPYLLPTLSNLRNRTNADGKPGSNRSEAREAETLVAQAIIMCTDFASMRVGTPMPNGTFLPRSHAYIAQMCLMGEQRKDGKWQPSSRFWRTIVRLKRAGFLEVQTVYVNEQGQKRARNSIKRVNPEFLISLETITYHSLTRLQNWSKKRLQEAKKSYQARYKSKLDLVRDAKSARLIEQRKQKATLRTAEILVEQEKTSKANKSRLAFCKTMQEQGKSLDEIKRLLTTFLSYESWNSS